MAKQVKRHAVVQPQDGSIRHIPLTQGKVAVVDADDYQWLMQYNWCASHQRHKWYAARRNELRRWIPMHRAIMNAQPGVEVDHRDNDGLNNRRMNLRMANSSQNSRNSKVRSDNTSGFKGVTWDEAHSQWRAQFFLNGKQRYIGLFQTAKDAALAYDQKALEHYGQFARTNFS